MVLVTMFLVLGRQLLPPEADGSPTTPRFGPEAIMLGVPLRVKGELVVS